MNPSTGTPPLLSKVQAWLLQAGQIGFLLALFAIPISKPLLNIGLLLAVAGSVLGERAPQRFATALRHPVVIGCMLWFGVLTLNAVRTALDGHGWYLAGSATFAWLYPWLGASLLENESQRRRALLTLGLGIGLILLISWAQFLGLLPQRDDAANSALRYTVFKEYTQQGLEFLTLASLALAFSLSTASRNRQRLLWLTGAAALCAVIFLLQSRTAFLTVIPLLAYGFWQGVSHSWRGRASTVLGLGLLVMALLTAAFTTNIQQRLVKAAQEEIGNYLNQQEPTSMGIRLELWRQTLPIIQQAPWLGHGLGQWKALYEPRIESLPNKDAFNMGHPHQEALQIATEEGLLGLAVYAILLVALARHARKLSTPYRHFYTCLLIIYVSAGLVNCLWADFSHRHLFILALACIPAWGQAPAVKRSQQG
ncbi:MAG TPA: O-antigen ligase family protein [Macromonas sp.]|nr:O-antigen ligase family protein [Macromonas sp.]